MEGRRVVFLGPQFSGRFSLMQSIARKFGPYVTRTEDIPHQDGYHDRRRIVEFSMGVRRVLLECVSPTILDYAAYCRAFVPGAVLVMVVPLRESGIDEDWIAGRDTEKVKEVLDCLADLSIDPFDPSVRWVFSQCDRSNGVPMVRNVPFGRMGVISTSTVSGAGIDELCDWIRSRLST